LADPKKQTLLSSEQISFSNELEKIIDCAGPKGWLQWTSDYRNMVVHRARRHRLTLIDPYEDPNLKGRPLAKIIGLMARSPSRTDLEDLEDFLVDKTRKPSTP
jgi:hypothetical protein